MYRLRLPVLMLALSLWAACAPYGAGPGAQSRTDPYRITSVELEAAAFSDAFALVQALRPRWLRERAASLTAGPERARVYVDGLSFGGPEALGRLPLSSLAGLEYLDGPSATQRFGTDHGGGVIMVTTFR